MYHSFLKNINIDNIRSVSPIQHNNSEASNYTKDGVTMMTIQITPLKDMHIYTYMINKL